jgi:hypothetical protein
VRGKKGFVQAEPDLRSYHVLRIIYVARPANTTPNINLSAVFLPSIHKVNIRYTITHNVVMADECKNMRTSEDRKPFRNAEAP